MMYVSLCYTLQYVYNVYQEEFQPVPLQSYWPEYNGIELCHNPIMRRDRKDRPQSVEFILKWIKGKVVDTQRDVVYAGMRDTTRKNVLTILMFLI
jgi:hypothetical protein